MAGRRASGSGTWAGATPRPGGFGGIGISRGVIHPSRAIGGRQDEGGLRTRSKKRPEVLAAGALCRQKGPGKEAGFPPLLDEAEDRRHFAPKGPTPWGSKEG